MAPALDPKAVATTNPAVDVKKLEDLEKIRILLESAGVLRKADYRIEPPLGTGRRTINPAEKWRYRP